LGSPTHAATNHPAQPLWAILPSRSTAWAKGDDQLLELVVEFRDVSVEHSYPGHILANKNTSTFAVSVAGQHDAGVRDLGVS
jgi:hypothetical protein